MNRSKPFAFAAVLLVAAALGALAGCGPEHAAHEVWYCPMHPTYASDRPGSCPICNMDLVKKDGATAPARATATASARGEREILYYRSPMDPAVTSPVPAKDAMGMAYVPVYADEVAGVSATVAGRAAVEVAGERLALAGVRTESARRDRLARTIRAVGSVVPDERRLHRAQTKIDGWVETLHVNFQGQYVRRGQPMLAIYSPELLASQQEYLLARATAERFRASTIPEVRRGGDDLVLAARRRLELFDVPESFLRELEGSSRPKRTVELTAPASGYVVAKEVVAGKRVEPGMELYTIADLAHVWVEADVYESEARAVAVGREATLRLPHDPSFALDAEIAYVFPQIEVATRTLRVRFDVANPGLVLKPGMFVDVELRVAEGEGVVIDDSAILDTGTRRIVFVETGPGQFAPREVVVALRADGRALVEHGLDAGEEVAVKANFLLDSESRLRAAVAAMTQEGGAATAPPAAGHQHGSGSGSQP
jgi:multidrug efflux pump subunit AcrA (membrane-fusion protein)